MILQIVALSIWVLIIAALPKQDFDLFSDEFIDHINSLQSTWKAGRNFPEGTSLEYIKDLMGLHPESSKPENRLEVKRHNISSNDPIPESFDSRTQWPNCPSIREIRDQGRCGSCWAFASVGVMSDRQCIHSGGKDLFHYSAQDLVSCESSDGCQGGSLSEGFRYWIESGVVSGGNYGSKQGCTPYEIPPCNMTDPNAKCTDFVKTPKCEKKCQPSYRIDYDNDKHYGKSAYRIHNNEKQIQVEIMENGPVVGSFAVYEDFIHFKSGVYKHIHGKFLGLHAIRVIGWGVEGNTPYWILANSWNSTWGDNGFVKILRGSDECGIESNIHAGIPK